GCRLHLASVEKGSPGLFEYPWKRAAQTVAQNSARKGGGDLGRSNERVSGQAGTRDASSSLCAHSSLTLAHHDRPQKQLRRECQGELDPKQPSPGRSL